jgi:ADP-ribose pyrophosphatase YjhB (NUDIX family)
MSHEPPRRVPCVGAVVVHEGRLLVVRRGHDPGRGLWSVPGGRVEAGETLARACAREVLEETGLVVEVGALVGTVERPSGEGATYVIDDLECAVVGPSTPRAGDDADDVRWVDREELEQLPLVDLLLETLDGWGVLDRLGRADGLSPPGSPRTPSPPP